MGGPPAALLYTNLIDTPLEKGVFKTLVFDKFNLLGRFPFVSPINGGVPPNYVPTGIKKSVCDAV